MAEMTPAALVELCKKHGGYRQPHLNDQLYLQLQGFRRIQNLEPYKNCKALWLDQNAISEVAGLSHMTELCTLFLQHNFIRRLNASALANLGNLRILDLSNNHLTRIGASALQHVPLLETLQLTHNRFATLAALRGILVCKHLSCVDLSFNLIEGIGSAETDSKHSDAEGNEEASNAGAAAAAAARDSDDKSGDDASNNNEDDEDKGDGEAATLAAANEEKDQAYIMTNNSDSLVAFWQQLPELGVLYLHGNELPRRCKFYRKRMICGLPQLTYLDERPIFPDERRTTEAWGRGGPEAEEQERGRIRDEKTAEMERNLRGMREMTDARKEERGRALRVRQQKEEEHAAWRAEMQVVWARERTEVDHEEFEQRSLLADDEEAAFRSRVEAMARGSLGAARLTEERRRVEALLLRDIAAESARIEREMLQERTAIRARHDEMRRMIEAFKNDTTIFPKHQLDTISGGDDDEEVHAVAATAAAAVASTSSASPAVKQDAEGLLRMLAQENEREIAKQREQQHVASPFLPAQQQQQTTQPQQPADKKQKMQHWDAFLDMESRNSSKRRRW